MALGVRFGGRKRVIPGAYSKLKARSLANKSGSGLTVAIVGDCTGGEPLALHTFYDPVDARDTLRSGNLLDACKFAWHPSPSLGGADKIYAVRCASDCIQGTFSLEDSQPVDVIDLSTRDYGAWVNSIRVKVENGTNVASYPGVKKITVENQEDPGVYEIGDDLGKAISLKYTGEGSDCLVTITLTAQNATELATACTGAAADDLTLDLALPAYDTLQKLVDHVNSQANYEATLVGEAARPSADLDAASAVDIKGETAVHFPAVLDCCIDWLNENSDYVSAVQTDTSENGAPANKVWTNFSNGSDGTEDTAAYTTALGLLAKQADIAYIIVASGTSGYQAQALTHVQDMERIYGFRRRVFCGSATGDSLSAAKTAAAAVRSFRSSFYYPGVKRNNEDETLTTYGGWAVAAMAAGLSVALHRESSLGNKDLFASDVESQLTKEEIVEALEGGICPVELVTGRGVRIVQGLTTDLSGDQFYYYQSNIDIADSIIRDIEDKLESRYMGEFANTTTLQSIRADIEADLQQAADQGVLLGEEDDDDPPYRNIEVWSSGGVVYFSYEARVASAIDFILQTGQFVIGSNATSQTVTA